MSRRERLLCGGLALAVACSTGVDRPVSRHARLPAGVAAQVGSDEIALETVQRISAAQLVSAQAARDRAVTDALFAAGARSAYEGRAVVPVLERAAWARALLEGLKNDALARGPATDAELAELTAVRWRELDRPESVRTTHAVVLVEKPADDTEARAVAEHIHEAVIGITDPEEFIRLAKAVPHDGVQVRAERLPAVTADGRVYDPDRPAADSSESFDPDFAKAAYALKAAQISEPVKSRFGYHVILCEVRVPELRVPLEQRRVLLHDDVMKGRAERAKQDLLKRLSTLQPIQVGRAADDLTSRVQVE